MNEQEEFKHWCEYYKVMFGLTEWDFYFDSDDSDEHVSECRINAFGCIATFTLSNNISDLVKSMQDWIRNTALHEVLHIAMSRYDKIAADRFVMSDDLERESERLVNLFQNVIRKMEDEDE